MVLNLFFIVFFYFLYGWVKLTQLLFVLVRIIGISLPDIFAKKNTILYLENFPVENAGYQYRAKKWADLFVAHNFDVRIKTLIEDKNKFDQFDKTRTSYLTFLLASIIKKYQYILSSIFYDRVIVRRELLFYNDYGNLFLEKMLLSIHPDAILDFDDDIGAAKKEPRVITNWFGRLLMEHSSKFYSSLKLYRQFIVGSHYLKSLVLAHHENLNPNRICVIPTCVDYDRHPAKKYAKKEEIVFGWIGGINNLYLLENILDALEEVSKSYKIRLLIISGQPLNKQTSFPIDFRPWGLNTEIEDMYRIDIGLMPLEDTIVARGKCGFKLIQYMGLGIVSIASAITINEEIVQDGIDSYLVSPKANWTSTMVKVIENKNFTQISNNAKMKINNYYTFTVNFKTYSDYLIKLCVE
jgi:glycosyltransferase involved in cell wall biosynthesis